MYIQEWYVYWAYVFTVLSKGQWSEDHSKFALWSTHQINNVAELMCSPLKQQRLKPEADLNARLYSCA